VISPPGGAALARSINLDSIDPEASLAGRARAAAAGFASQAASAARGRKPMFKTLSAAVLAALACTLPGASGAQTLPERDFTVVGTWGMLSHWRDREDAFWNKTIPEASGGSYTINAKPLTELGLTGHGMMRDLSVGAFDFAHGVFLYVSADSPVIDGGDLAGVVPDLASMRQAMDAYLPVLNEEFAAKYDSTILMLYAWPRSYMYCNLPADTPDQIGLDVLKNLKIRSYGASLADLIGALEAQPVPVAFGDVPQALQRGVIDCGVTGVASAYDAKWYQVATHEVRIPVGYTASFLAVNNEVWNGLKPEEQEFFRTQAAALEEIMWTATAAEDERGMTCNTTGPCATEVGGMKAVTLTPEAAAELKTRVQEGVLKSFAARCDAVSPGCAARWSETIGAALGYDAL
jgi:TRAP-type C4-dicarboxylate transport system substrate-binding protein